MWLKGESIRYEFFWKTCGQWWVTYSIDPSWDLLPVRLEGDIDHIWVSFWKAAGPTGLQFLPEILDEDANLEGSLPEIVESLEKDYETLEVGKEK